jgi:hypothetical protein
MSVDVGVFRPAGASFQIIATTAGVAGSLVTGTTSNGVDQNPPNNASVRLAATGTSGALVQFGGSGVTVTGTTGMPIALNAVGEKFSFADYTRIAAMAQAGTSTLTVTFGGGL